jgi:hypothetical protein
VSFEISVLVDHSPKKTPGWKARRVSIYCYMIMKKNIIKLYQMNIDMWILKAVLHSK